MTRTSLRVFKFKVEKGFGDVVGKEIVVNPTSKFTTYSILSSARSTSAEYQSYFDKLSVSGIKVGTRLIIAGKLVSPYNQGLPVNESKSFAADQIVEFAGTAPTPPAPISPVPSPAPTLSPITGNPVIDVEYNGQYYRSLNSSSNPLNVKKGETFIVRASHSSANNLVLSTFCSNSSTCNLSEYLMTSTPIMGGDSQKVTITANYTGEYSVWSRIPNSEKSESFRVNISE